MLLDSGSLTQWVRWQWSQVGKASAAGGRQVQFVDFFVRLVVPQLLQSVHKLAPVINTWLGQLLQHHITMLCQYWRTVLLLLVALHCISSQLPKNGICSWLYTQRTVECCDSNSSSQGLHDNVRKTEICLSPHETVLLRHYMKQNSSNNEHVSNTYCNSDSPRLQKPSLPL